MPLPEAPPVTPRVPAMTRLPSLTGMRFLAAFLVFAFHATFALPLRDTALGVHYANLVSKAGYVGVGFFFILSGFVLTWTVRPGDSAGQFWRRRFAKVFP